MEVWMHGASPVSSLSSQLSPDETVGEGSSFHSLPLPMWL